MARGEKSYDSLEEEHGAGGSRPRQRCTDAPCCVVFVLTLVAFSSTYGSALSNGKIGRLYHGVDYSGAACGVDSGVESKPYVFWCISPVSQDGVSVDLDMKRPICVSRCPNSSAASWGEEGGAADGCAAITGSLASSEYPTTLVLQRYCLPKLERHAGVVSERLGQSGTLLMRDASSIASAWPALLGSFLMSFSLGYAYLFLLRRFARTMMQASILASFLLFFFLGVHLLSSSSGGSAAPTDGGEELPSGLGLHRARLASVLGTACLLLSLALLCTCCCYAHSIKVAVSCVEVACEVLFDMPSLLLVPGMRAMVKGLLFLVLLSGFLMLQASARLGGAAGGETISTPQPDSGHWTQTILYSLVAFWILAFANALFQFAVAYAIAEYYYAPYDDDMEKDVGIMAVWTGLSVGLVRHGGSLALGSLLIAVLRVFQKVLKDANEQQHCEAIHIALKCCQCVVCCCEDILQTVNELAYVDIAINSSDFCSAARHAVGAMSTVGGPLPFLSGCVHTFTFFGTVAVTGLSAGVVYVVCSHGIFADASSDYVVENPHVPAAIAAGIGFFVAQAFGGVFDMTSDALLYCYGLDLHDGASAETAPPGLRRLILSKGGGPVEKSSGSSSSRNKK